jgi:hypothetical protein
MLTAARRLRSKSSKITDGAERATDMLGTPYDFRAYSSAYGRSRELRSQAECVERDAAKLDEQILDLERRSKAPRFS